MTGSLIRLAAGTFLLLLMATGIISCSSSTEEALLEDENTSSSDAEVVVTIAVPEGETLTGTAIFTLEDLTIQDAPAVELARVTTPASSLMDALPSITIPIDLNLVNPDAEINVAVHIDSDDDGLFSDGDWMSDSIVNVINNGEMAVVIDIVKIGV